MSRRLERRPWLTVRSGQGPPDDLSDAAQVAAFWRRQFPGLSFVYFIQAQQGTPYKIGIARDVLRRMAALQTANSQELHLAAVIPGGAALEVLLHRALRGECVRGEWFQGPMTNKIVARAWKHSDEAVEHYWSTGELIDTMEVEAPPKRSARHKWRTSGYAHLGRAA